MRLSEAIRLGALLGPQAFRVVRDLDGATCAFGAASDAAGLQFDVMDPYAMVDALTEAWPWLVKRLRCPACRRRRVGGAVISDCLNDHHRWTRERIADWVATVEPDETPAAQSTTSDVRGTEVVEA